jgi:hypothetical protein
MTEEAMKAGFVSMRVLDGSLDEVLMCSECHNWQALGHARGCHQRPIRRGRHPATPRQPMTGDEVIDK